MDLWLLTQKKIIEQLARNYHVKRVVLFGSSLSPAQEYRDIDITFSMSPQ